MTTKTAFLEDFGGSIARAAKALQISRGTIYAWPEDLHEAALRHIRDYHLRTYGKVPKKWMPPVTGSP